MSDEPHFRFFAQSLKAAKERLAQADSGSFLAQQRRQLEGLVRLERDFRRALVKHAWGPGVYRDFVDYICDERRNILDARPYFRERAQRFTDEVSIALRLRRPRGLYRFAVNYRFVAFALRARAWHPNSDIRRLAGEIERARHELVVMNMPLAISRAHIFYRRTQKAHLTYMDLIQIAAEGLMAGIDKFCLPFSAKWRAVAIGRMTGNFIEQYSETSLHFYPRYKRILYRARKIMGQYPPGSVDMEELAARVNEGVDPAYRTTAAELSDLLAASSTVSTTPTPAQDDDGDDGREDRHAAPDDARPDVQAERREALLAVQDAFQYLTVFERKLLRLKTGVNPADL